MHRGDGGRPLARGQPRCWGLGLAAVGPGSDLWLSPSSCKEKRPLVTHLLATGCREGARVPFQSLQKWPVAGEELIPGLLRCGGERRGGCSGAGGRLRGLQEVSVPALRCSALCGLMPPTVPWSGSRAGAATNLCRIRSRAARGSSHKCGSRDRSSVCRWAGTHRELCGCWSPQHIPRGLHGQDGV